MCDISRVARGNSVNEARTRGLRFKCEADICHGGNYVVANTMFGLGGSSPRRVRGEVGSCVGHHSAGRPLRCPDTNDIFGEPRNTFTNTLVRRYKLGNGAINNTRIDRGRTKFVVGGSGTATSSMGRLISRVRGAIRGRANCGLRYRLVFLWDGGNMVL